MQWENTVVDFINWKLIGLWNDGVHIINGPECEIAMLFFGITLCTIHQCAIRHKCVALVKLMCSYYTNVIQLVELMCTFLFHVDFKQYTVVGTNLKIFEK